MDSAVEGVWLHQLQQQQHQATDNTGTTTSNSGVEPWVAFIAGITSGCAGIIVGQPFDVIKTRLQCASASTYSGALDCCRQTVSKEGIGALFKGCIPPLASAPFINAIAFAAYARASEWQLTRRTEPAPAQSINGTQLTPLETFLAGSAAGACQTVVVLPCDNIKTKLQVQVGSATYRGTWDCAQQLVRAHGPRALLAGGTATLWRELPAYGVYFCMYETMRVELRTRFGAGETAACLTAGGLAGCASWLSVAPLDVIKSRQQAMSDCLSREATSMVFCARTMYAEGGTRIFFRGLGTTMLRAFPVNAAIFAVYEQTAKLLRQTVPLANGAVTTVRTQQQQHQQPTTAGAL